VWVLTSAILFCPAILCLTFYILLAWDPAKRDTSWVKLLFNFPYLQQLITGHASQRDYNIFESFSQRVRYRFELFHLFWSSRSLYSASLILRWVTLSCIVEWLDWHIHECREHPSVRPRGANSPSPRKAPSFFCGMWCWCTDSVTTYSELSSDASIPRFKFLENGDHTVQGKYLL
jgi:hypothetical protein